MPKVLDKTAPTGQNWINSKPPTKGRTMELMAPKVTAMVDAGTITADQARESYMLSLLLVEFLHTEAHRGDIAAMFDNNTREQFIEGLMADTSFTHRFGMFLVNKRGA